MIMWKFCDKCGCPVDKEEECCPDCNGSKFHLPTEIKKERISKDEYYLNIALQVSKRSTCLKRHYGAIIVNNDEIVSTGFNGSPRGCKNCCDIGICKRLNKPHNSGDYSDCHSVHAEQNAMLSASRREMIGATLYLVGEEFIDGEWKEVEDSKPCPICARMIMNAGIYQVKNREGIIIVPDLI